MKYTKVVVGVAAVLTHKKKKTNQVLTIRERKTNSQIGKRKHMVAIPMGHLKIGEDPLKGIIREIKEETGYKHIEIKKILGLYLIRGALGIAYLGQVSGKQYKSKDKDVFELKFSDVKDLLNQHKFKLRPGVWQILDDYIHNKNTYSLQLITNCI